MCAVSVDTSLFEFTKSVRKTILGMVGVNKKDDKAQVRLDKQEWKEIGRVRETVM